MSVSRRVSRGALVVAISTLLALTLLTGAAVAKPLERGRIHEAGSSVETWDWCGDVIVERAWDDYLNLLLNVRKPSGLPYFQATIHGSTAFTNVSTGKAMTFVYNFVDKDLEVTENEDGETLTLLIMNTGGNKVLGSDGKLVFNDPGQIRFEVLVDHNGTPTDPYDDGEPVFLGLVKGSTGRNDTEGRDFCEDFLAITS